MNVDKKGNGNLKAAIPSTVMTVQKGLDNVEYTDCSGNMITKDARCRCKIKSRIVIKKRHSSR